MEQFIIPNKSIDRELQKFGVKVTPKKDIRVLRETMKRIVFSLEKTRSSCELINVNRSAWIVPCEFVEFIIEGAEGNFQYSTEIVDRIHCVSKTISKWGMMEFPPNVVDKHRSLKDFGLIVLKHQTPESKRVKQYNYSEILDSIKLYLETGENYEPNN